MEWTAETEGRELQRIVALLLALAGLADRAGVMPFPVRFIVLAILRRAETVAWAFIVGATRGPSRAGVIAPVPCRGNRAEAVRLALGLRMLAAFVAELAAQATAGVSPGCYLDFIPTGARPSIHALAAFSAHDTS